MSKKAMLVSERREAEQTSRRRTVMATRPYTGLHELGMRPQREFCWRREQVSPSRIIVERRGWMLICVESSCILLRVMSSKNASTKILQIR